MKKLLNPLISILQKHPVNAMLMSVTCLISPYLGDQNGSSPGISVPSILMNTITASQDKIKVLHHGLVEVKEPFDTIPIEQMDGDPVGDPAPVASRLATRPDCCCEKVTEVLETATKSLSSVKINCNLTLKRGDTVTKRMIFEGPSSSNITVNGNGAVLFCGKQDSVNYNKDMIEIRSKSYIVSDKRRWERPENITIKNLHITGSVRIWGMAKNGQGFEYEDSGVLVNHYKNSSRTIDHPNTARLNAPKFITFDNVVITGVGRNPLYFGPGVSYSKLINSEMKGESVAVAIYLDAESYKITIKNNYIYTTTGSHFIRPDEPLIAIDGSSYNTIINNRFSSLNNGGIFLYRNCGEGGVIRHSTPSHNKIVNNIFYYNKYTGLDPAVYLSSKNAEFTRTGGFLGFCDDDAGYKFGSSRSDLDYAQFNIVMQNQIYKRSVKEMIRTKNPSVNSPNYIGHNETVTKETKRLAGCYISSGYQKDFILHGESIDVFKNSKGEPVCTGYKYTCNDGELNYSPVSTCSITEVDFECRANGNNAGCQKLVSCRSGQKIIGATAAANLESGSVTFNELENVKVNTLKVVRASDHIWEGVAFVGNTRSMYGERAITGINGLQNVVVGCKETDSNGGDCHIKGTLYCYGSANTVKAVMNEKPAVPVQANEIATSPIVAKKAIQEGEEEKSKFGLAIFPNPTTYDFQVRIGGLNKNGQASLRVFDTNGKVIEMINDISSGRVLRLGGRYPRGIYIIEAIQGNERKVGKLIKQ